MTAIEHALVWMGAILLAYVVFCTWVLTTVIKSLSERVEGLWSDLCEVKKALKEKGEKK